LLSTPPRQGCFDPSLWLLSRNCLSALSIGSGEDPSIAGLELAADQAQHVILDRHKLGHCHNVDRPRLGEGDIEHFLERPGASLITYTRSARKMASSTSWVMKKIFG